MPVHPLIHFPKHMEHGFPPGVAMRLQRQQNKTNGAALPFDSAATFRYMPYLRFLSFSF
jgi:hypothetical protein